MPKTLTVQSSFNAGVLDPRLASRTDLDKYYSGAATGLNVLCTPQGGFKRRPGMKYLATLATSGRLASFSFNTEQSYLLVFTNLNIAIYKDGVHQANVTSPWTSAQLAALRFVQSADTMILVHESHAPRKLVRGATHTSWTLSAISFVAVPEYDFDDASSPASADEVQRLTFNGTWANTDDFKLDLDGEISTLIDYSTTTATTASRIQDALRALPNTSATGITVAYVAASSPPEFDVTFGGADGKIDWSELEVNLVRTVGSGTLAISTITEGLNPSEPLWSAGRGYPKSVTFHQGRLWFGGFAQRPATVAASVTNDFFNFDEGSGLDDQAIVATLDTDQVNSISAITSSRHLQIFTSGGEFIEKSVPVTPANISIQRQTQFGSIDLQPVSIDGATLFVERRGKAVREFLYTFAEDAYNAAPVSILAPHLINAPVDIAARKGTASDDANLVFVVNADGTMAVLNSLRSENVAGWTPWETNGSIKAVVAVIDEVYFIVERSINSSTVYYLEQADETLRTDASILVINGPASATVAGLSHLEGELCRVRADGAIMTDATPASGSITLSRTAESIEVGLHHDVIMKTMPLNVNFANGPTLLREKRPFHVQIDLYESNGVVIQGKRLPDRSMSGALPDVPEPYTGMKEVWLNGWSHLADITIECPDPLPFFMRSLSVDVEVST